MTDPVGKTIMLAQLRAAVLRVEAESEDQLFLPLPDDCCRPYEKAPFTKGSEIVPDPFKKHEKRAHRHTWVAGPERKRGPTGPKF